MNSTDETLKVVVIDNLLTVMDMPPVQLLTLLASREEEVAKLQLKLKSNIVGLAIDGFENQPEDSYLKQKLAISTCVEAINSYCNILKEGLQIVTTALMAKRALQLGG
eukprot:15364387-Ditylum_brightwellii.AAC.1